LLKLLSQAVEFRFRSGFLDYLRHINQL
jgi:hypothetical protein